ncbi:MAG: hypothetical protein MJ147_08400 [Clostridia bacterium]|nr:hypothetical protein [Clostridia bacterium]
MKKFAAVWFVFLFAIFSLNAFAVDGEVPSYIENKDKNPLTITLWNTDEYTFAFDLTEDFQTVKSSYVQGEQVYNEETEETDDTSVTGRKCFSLTAEKGGYYAVVFESPVSIVTKAEVRKADDDKIEGLFKEQIEILNEKNNYCGIVVKMKANEKEYVLADETTEGEYSAKYIYLGEKVVSAECAGPLVFDFDTSNADAYEGDKAIPVVEMYPLVNVKFSTGETVKIQPFVQAKNAESQKDVSAEIEFFGEKYPVTISFVEMADMVKEIALPDGFKPACTVNFDGTMTDFKYPEYVAVKLTSGETIKAKRDESVVLPNGRSYNLWAEYGIAEEGVLTDKLSFTYALNGLSENKIEVTPDRQSVKDTFKGILNKSKEDLKFGIKILKGESEDFTKKDGINRLVSCPKQIINGVKYYALFGDYLNATLIALIGIAPLLLIAAIIIIVAKSKKKHK